MLPVCLNRTVILSLLLVASVSTSFAADAKKAAPQPGGAKAKAKQELPPNPKKLSPPPGFPVSAEAKAEIMKGVAGLDRGRLEMGSRDAVNNLLYRKRKKKTQC